MIRETRSGRSYAQWVGPPVIPPTTDFDFPSLLQEATARAEANLDEEDDDYEAFFSLSPLSSPENTPPPSPLIKPTQLPQSDPHAQTFPSTNAQNFAPPTIDPASESGDLDETPEARRKRKKKDYAKVARQLKRQAEKATAGFSHLTGRPGTQAKHVQQSIPLPTPMDHSKSKVASTAYVGLDDRERSQRVYTLEELVGPDSEFKFERVVWTGKSSIPVVSKDGGLVAILVSHPGTADWTRIIKEGEELLASAGERCSIPENCHTHRRGMFSALRCGASHGGGQKRPSNLRNKAVNDEILQGLNNSEPFRRISGLATSVMATWAPDLYCYYCTTLAKLHAHYPRLKRLFPGSVFSASTYNLGPQTVCFKHTDFANLPFGLCAVTAFGDYDYTKGGHLIIWDCHLVIEFPPGATILLPSAIVAHSNTAIAPHERRFSFTQYTAGGLFRWVENGFQKSVDFYASLSKEEKVVQEEKNKNRWAFGLSLLPCFKLS